MLQHQNLNSVRRLLLQMQESPEVTAVQGKPEFVAFQESQGLLE